MRRNEDKDGEENGDKADNENSPAEAIRLFDGFVVCEVIIELDAEKSSSQKGNPARELSGSPVECDGLPGGFEGALEWWQAAPEALG